ncbi:MAG: hypothetical protein RBR71_07355 [Gudongella sp.]|nr:hypothetical protein [Gudongella sp.]
MKSMLPGEETFETFLNEVNTKERQETLKDLGKSDSLRLDTFVIDEILGFEVFTSDKKIIGTIPAKKSITLEVGMGRGLEPYVIDYIVIKDEEGIFTCNVTIGLKYQE